MIDLSDPTKAIRRRVQRIIKQMHAATDCFPLYLLVKSVRIESVIGSGASSDVYKGHYAGKDVAVKKVRDAGNMQKVSGDIFSQ